MKVKETVAGYLVLPTDHAGPIRWEFIWRGTINRVVPGQLAGYVEIFSEGAWLGSFAHTPLEMMQALDGFTEYVPLDALDELLGPPRPPVEVDLEDTPF